VAAALAARADRRWRRQVARGEAVAGVGGEDMKAGAAERDVTPAVGLPIAAPTRRSVGVHDPLFARGLVLEDEAPRDGTGAKGTSVAILCFDLIGSGFEVADQVRQAVREHTGIEHVLLNFGHPHSSRALGPRGERGEMTDEEVAWNDGVHRAILEIVAEAQANAVPVSLRVGRAPAQVGFNRRITHEDGSIGMGDNKEGAVVPWVNVLVAQEREGETPLAVLFEHAAHPVIVPDTSGLTSADYPGAAVARINAVLGDEVTAMFAQGCGGNINGYPLRTTHENADKAGRQLGDAVLRAVRESVPIKADKLAVRSARAQLPCQPYPSMAVWQQALDNLESDWKRGTESGRPVDWITEEVYLNTVKSLEALKGMIERGESPPPRRFDVAAVMLGSEWCLVAMPHEMFCEYELWIDDNAPFDRTMTFAYTNGGSGYVATDEALAMGEKGGYEAGSLPCWWAHGAASENRSPPAVGTEGMIKDAIASLWPPPPDRV